MGHRAFGATRIATIASLVITALALVACGPGATTSPPGPTASVDRTAAPTGSGTLEPAPAFAKPDEITVLPGNSTNVVAADLNEDGKLDLVTTTFSRLGIAVLLGRGEGTFKDGPDIEVAPAQVVQAADLNGDGHLDLVAAGDQLVVLLGRGDATFKPPVSYAGGLATRDPAAQAPNLFGLAIADLNADKIPDVVAANYVGSQLVVLLGMGDGTFKPASIYRCPGCTSAAAADLDKDGKVDVVAGNATLSSPGAMDVFLNDGTGKFMPPVAYDPRGNAAGVALGDLNGDGALDAITANDRSYTVAVLLGRGNGTFADAKTYPAGNTHTVVVVDLDRDGKLDVLSASFEHTKVWFYRGTGDGGLVETQGIEAAPDTAQGLAAADLNGDGKLDLALTESSVDHAAVTVLLAK
jgi:hypothetical protein